MQFFTFPLLALPIAAWVISAAFFIYCEVKMLSLVAHDGEISRTSRIVWSVLMVPFLPLTALVYLLRRHNHHTLHHAS